VDEQFVFEEDAELIDEEAIDEFETYFNEQETPKILLTTAVRPKRELFEFLKEVKTAFPNSFYYPRMNFSLKEICEFAPSKGYTDIMIWRETRRRVDQLTLIHLPNGPTAVFKVSNCVLNKEIAHHANVTDHFPELILKNFNSKVGRRVGRFFASLFPQRPEFKGRRVVTLHNQRDFLFFRHHRYMFQEGSKGVDLQEIGPRFTLKLQKLQLGTFDNVFGQIEWLATDKMYVSRKKTYL